MVAKESINKENYNKFTREAIQQILYFLIRIDHYNNDHIVIIKMYLKLDFKNSIFNCILPFTHFIILISIKCKYIFVCTFKYA